MDKAKKALWDFNETIKEILDTGPAIIERDPSLDRQIIPAARLDDYIIWYFIRATRGLVQIETVQYIRKMHRAFYKPFTRVINIEGEDRKFKWFFLDDLEDSLEMSLEGSYREGHERIWPKLPMTATSSLAGPSFLRNENVTFTLHQKRTPSLKDFRNGGNIRIS